MSESIVSCVACSVHVPTAACIEGTECCIACWHALRPMLPFVDEKREYDTTVVFMIRNPDADLLYLPPRPVGELTRAFDAWTRPTSKVDEYPYEDMRPFPRRPESSATIVTPVVFRTNTRDAVLDGLEPFAPTAKCVCVKKTKSGALSMDLNHLLVDLRNEKNCIHNCVDTHSNIMFFDTWSRGHTTRHIVGSELLQTRQPY